MKEILKERKTEWIRKGQEVFCLFFIQQGMCLCMERILSISIPGRFRLMAVIGLVLMTEFAARSWRWLLAETAVFLGGLLWLWIKYQDILQRAVKEISNRILELINQYHRTDFLYWYLGETSESYGWMALLIVCALMGFLEGVILLKSRESTYHLHFVLVLPVLIVTAGLMVGKSASFAGILLILIGALIEMLDIRQRGLILIAAGIVLSVGLSVLMAGSRNLWDQMEVWHVDWQKKQLALEDRMLEILNEIGNISLFSGGEKKEYDLTNEEPAITGEKIFEITVDSPVIQNLYIRGFVGGTYENGKWENVSRQEFSDWAQQQGGSEQEYSRVVQSFPYELLSHASEIYYVPKGKKRQVSLEIAGDIQGYTLMPYFTQIPKEQSVKADGAYPPAQGSQFYWESYLSLLDSQVEMAGIPVLEAFLTDQGKLEHYEIWTNYEKYVQETYTRLPDDELQNMKNYAKERVRQEELKYAEEMQAIAEEKEEAYVSVSDRMRSIQMIQNMLWENNRYSFDLQPVPEGEDYTEYFLLTQNKGYCVHFATAATLLFRMNDIPARFVSGYLVMPSDFKKNKDGTWTAVVTDERAHAWTEVFQHNIGFCPVEVTPPSYTEMIEEMEEGESLVYAVEQKEQEEYGGQKETDNRESENQQKPKEQQEEVKKEEQNRKNVTETDGTGIREEDDFRLIWVVLWILLFLGSMLGMYVLFRHYRKWALKKRLHRISLEDRTQAVREIGKELNRMLRKMGYGHKGEKNDREYQRILEKELPEFQWEQAFFILQKAVFSESGVTEEEYQAVLSLYNSLEQRE